MTAAGMLEMSPVGRGHVAKALVAASVIVMLDEGFDLVAADHEL